MATVTQPLRAEHKDLLPHAHAEEQALYPVVAEVMGAKKATATMSRDHVEVERLTRELAILRMIVAEHPLAGEHVKALRRVLYGLYALVRLHFTKEEEVTVHRWGKRGFGGCPQEKRSAVGRTRANARITFPPMKKISRKQDVLGEV